jgi:hypothetical protein
MMEHLLLSVLANKRELPLTMEVAQMVSSSKEARLALIPTSIHNSQLPQQEQQQLVKITLGSLS